MPDTLEQKIARYGPRLYGLCVRLCGSMSIALPVLEETSRPSMMVSRPCCTAAFTF